MPLRASLQRAFQLAFFIHGEREVASRIAVEAVARTEVAATAQKKRRYYHPVGRSSPSDPAAGAPHRTKVSMEGAQLLQRLVYVVSDPYERRQETASRGELSEEDMIIRFVKHLVRLTVKRNSFYVSLGVGRLLHDYGTSDAMDLYSLVVGDPGRSRDDYYYRSRKRQLMKELEERFAGLLEVVRGARGETRFRVHDDDTGRELVGKCLQAFTPWDTRCTVPSDFDPQSQELESLVFADDDPDREHPVELRRMHALLHPGCFQALVASLGLEAPGQRLQVPCFAGAQGGSGGGGRDSGEELDGAELGELVGVLEEQAQRRRHHQATILSVAVDGVEKARFEPSREAGARFELDPGAELVEVFSHPLGEEPLLLATRLLEDLEGLESIGEPIDLAFSTGRHEVHFRLQGAGPSIWLQVACREVGWWAALGAGARQILERWGSGWSVPLPAAGAVAGVLLAVAVGVGLREELAVDLGTVRDHEATSSPLPSPGTEGTTRSALPARGGTAERLGLWIQSAPDLQARNLLSPLLGALEGLDPVVLVEDSEAAVLALKWLVEEPETLALVDVDGRILWRGGWSEATAPALAPELRRAVEAHLHSP